MTDHLYDDVIDLLLNDCSGWVFFTEKVKLAETGKLVIADGLYHYLNDVHIFTVAEYGPNVLIICSGSLRRGAWNYHDSIAEIFLPYGEVLTDVIEILPYTLAEYEDG